MFSVVFLAGGVEMKTKLQMPQSGKTSSFDSFSENKRLFLVLGV